MKLYHIRVDEYDGYQEYIPGFVRQFGKGIAVRHSGKKGNNPHFHMCIHTLGSKKELTDAFKEVFNKGKGNKHHFVGELDDRLDSRSYLFHEPNAKVIINHNYTEDEIVTFREMNNAVQASFLTTEKVIEMGIEEFRGRHIYPAHHGRDTVNGLKFEMFKWIMAVYHQHGKYFPKKYIVEQIINKIRIGVCEVEMRDPDEVYLQMYNEYFPFN